MDSLETKKPRYNTFPIVVFLIVIFSALSIRIIRFFQEKNDPILLEKTSGENIQMSEKNSEKDTPQENVKKTSLLETTRKVRLEPKTLLSISGTATIRFADPKFLTVRARLPEAKNGYVFSIWLYGNELQEYKYVGKMYKNSIGEFELEYLFDEKDFTLDDIILILSPEGENAARGTELLRGKLR